MFFLLYGYGDTILAMSVSMIILIIVVLSSYIYIFKRENKDMEL